METTDRGYRGYMSYGLNSGWGEPIGDYIGFWGGPITGYTTNLVQGSHNLQVEKNVENEMETGL